MHYVLQEAKLKKPEPDLFWAHCNKGKNCSLTQFGGKVSSGKCRIINGIFIEWIREPIACECVSYTLMMTLVEKKLHIYNTYSQVKQFINNPSANLTHKKMVYTNWAYQIIRSLNCKFISFNSSSLTYVFTINPNQDPFVLVKTKKTRRSDNLRDLYIKANAFLQQIECDKFFSDQEIHEAPTLAFVRANKQKRMIDRVDLTAHQQRCAEIAYKLSGIFFNTVNDTFWSNILCSSKRSLISDTDVKSLMKKINKALRKHKKPIKYSQTQIESASDYQSKEKDRPRKRSKYHQNSSRYITQEKDCTWTIYIRRIGCSFRKTKIPTQEEAETECKALLDREGFSTNGEYPLARTHPDPNSILPDPSRGFTRRPWNKMEKIMACGLRHNFKTCTLSFIVIQLQVHLQSIRSLNSLMHFFRKYQYSYKNYRGHELLFYAYLYTETFAEIQIFEPKMGKPFNLQIYRLRGYYGLNWHCTVLNKELENSIEAKTTMSHPMDVKNIIAAFLQINPDIIIQFGTKCEQFKLSKRILLHTQAFQYHKSRIYSAFTKRYTNKVKEQRLSRLNLTQRYKYVEFKAMTDPKEIVKQLFDWVPQLAREMDPFYFCSKNLENCFIPHYKDVLKVPLNFGDEHHYLPWYFLNNLDPTRYDYQQEPVVIIPWPFHNLMQTVHTGFTLKLLQQKIEEKDPEIWYTILKDQFFQLEIKNVLINTVGSNRQNDFYLDLLCLIIKNTIMTSAQLRIVRKSLRFYKSKIVFYEGEEFDYTSN